MDERDGDGGASWRCGEGQPCKFLDERGGCVGRHEAGGQEHICKLEETNPLLRLGAFVHVASLITADRRGSRFRVFDMDITAFLTIQRFPFLKPSHARAFRASNMKERNSSVSVASINNNLLKTSCTLLYV